MGPKLKAQRAAAVSTLENSPFSPHPPARLSPKSMNVHDSIARKQNTVLPSVQPGANSMFGFIKTGREPGKDTRSGVCYRAAERLISTLKERARRVHWVANVEWAYSKRQSPFELGQADDFAWAAQRSFTFSSPSKASCRQCPRHVFPRGASLAEGLPSRLARCRTV